MTEPNIFFCAPGKSYELVTTWGWGNDARMYISGWTVALRGNICNAVYDGLYYTLNKYDF